MRDLLQCTFMQTWFSPLHVETKNEVLKTRCVHISEKIYKFVPYHMMSNKNYHVQYELQLDFYHVKQVSKDHSLYKQYSITPYMM